jgi:hypothetical protein
LMLLHKDVSARVFRRLEWSCPQWPIYLTWMFWSLPFPFLQYMMEYVSNVINHQLPERREFLSMVRN